MTALDEPYSPSCKIAMSSSTIERVGYSVADVATMFGVSQWNVRMAIKEGQIQVLRWGRRLIIPKTEIDRLIG